MVFIVQLTIGIMRYLENDLCRVLQVAGLNLNSHIWTRSKGIINAKKGSLFKTLKMDDFYRTAHYRHYAVSRKRPLSGFTGRRP